MSQLIKNAKLSWNEQGEPSADLFDDLYFSTNDGLAETHYVFIEQNKLSQRWHDCTASFYVIAETGFGSGLNFLATWQHFQAWRTLNPEHVLKRLYFISFEKFPLDRKDLASTHQRWPQLAELAQQLQNKYPSPVAGCHRLEFSLGDGAMIILDLWLGDIKDTLPSLHYTEEGLIDCWFLDGFAPSKNPDMWNDTLYKNMAKCTKDNATLATFTAAGSVRRGLLAAGFSITKVKGYGKKREMITGQFARPVPSSSQISWYSRQIGQLACTKPEDKVIIIGGGIASAATALALAKRSIDVTIVCKDDDLALGASGNRQGGFYPLLNANNDHLSQFYSQAFGYANNSYRPFISKNRNIGDFCGVIQLAYDDKQKKRQQSLLQSELFPLELIHSLSEKEIFDFAGVASNCSGVIYPQGGWISPKQMSRALITQANQHSQVEVLTKLSIKEIIADENGYRLASDSTELNCTALILANGHHLTNFEQTRHLPMYATGGQVSHIPSTKQSAKLKSVLCYQGYITPVQESMHCIGASFNRNIEDCDLNSTVQQQNINKLTQDTNNANWTQALAKAPLAGKIGVRMSVKDHLPMVGNVPKFTGTVRQYHDLNKGKPARAYRAAPLYHGLYMIGGLGSRGICSAPLLGEVLVAQLTNEPQPLPQGLLNKLNPNRYWIKQLKQGKELGSNFPSEQQDV